MATTSITFSKSLTPPIALLAHVVSKESLLLFPPQEPSIIEVRKIFIWTTAPCHCRTAATYQNYHLLWPNPPSP